MGVYVLSYPVIILSLGTLALAVWERLSPGRELPHSRWWYMRALGSNLVHVLMLSSLGFLFDDFFKKHTLFRLGEGLPAVLEGVVLWFFGTLLFYWWHRLEHKSNFFWRIFHQVHHSPSRIETVTAFYKHPIETLAEIILGSFALYMVFGASPEAMAWYGTFIALSAFFSHANIRTPRWIGYIQQRPEQHSIHHQWDLHKYNYSDLILWDRIFGTFKEADKFSERCGFPKDHELRIREMLMFKDVY